MPADPTTPTAEPDRHPTTLPPQLSRTLVPPWFLHRPSSLVISLVSLSIFLLPSRLSRAPYIRFDMITFSYSSQQPFLSDRADPRTLVFHLLPILLLQHRRAGARPGRWPRHRPSLNLCPCHRSEAPFDFTHTSPPPTYNGTLVLLQATRCVDVTLYHLYHHHLAREVAACARQ